MGRVLIKIAFNQDLTPQTAVYLAHRSQISIYKLLIIHWLRTRDKNVGWVG